MRGSLALACAMLFAMKAQAAACMIVYGHGRNLGEPAQMQAWDRLNARFNAAVTERLNAAGQNARPLLFRTGQTELAAAVQQLLATAQREGCARVVDTAVFANLADPAQQTLTVRLRVHPILASAGPPRIGPPLYTSQNDFDLRQRSAERLDLEALAGVMVEAYLVEKGTTPPPA